jgi:flagellin
MSYEIRPPFRALGESSNTLNNTFKKLATGKRITSGSEDAAGLAIANSLEAEIAVSKQGRRNTLDASSALNIADGAYQQLNDMSGRMAELATQASSSILSADQRAALDAEYQQLKQETSRLTQTTEFNGVKLLAGQSLSVQVGTDGSSNSGLTVTSPDVSSLTSGIAADSLLSDSAARTALDNLRTFSTNVSQTRGAAGAFASRLDSARDVAAASEEGKAAALAQIQDYDYAQGVAEKTASQIRQNISASLVGQSSNLNGQVALALLS